MGQKLKFVISDLHLGAGDALNGGNRLEDFTADEKLVNFLHEITQESERDQREVELIINGDLFEFLQVPSVDQFDAQAIYPPEAYLDSSEIASVKRLNLITDGHPEIFEALSDFMHIEAPQRRITIIKGNHDVNLFWPAVKGRLREALGATGPRASLLLFAEEFVSREKIYVEHGHQRTEKVNSYPDFLDPRLPGQPTQLYYPAGSHFVINFFNDVEYRYWFIDSIKPITTMIWYALQWDFNFAIRTLTALLRYAPELALHSFAAGDPEASPAGVLLEELEDEQSRQQLGQQYKTDPNFRQQFNGRIQQALSSANLPNKGVSAFGMAATSSSPIAMGRAAQEQQWSVLYRAAEEITRQEGATVVLFGHTHHPVEETLDKGAVYLNTGCWLWAEDFSDAPAETWEALFKGSYKSEEHTARLPYARIDYDESGVPTARLIDFAAEDQPFLPEEQVQSFWQRLYYRLMRFLKIG